MELFDPASQLKEYWITKINAYLNRFLLKYRVKYTNISPLSQLTSANSPALSPLDKASPHSSPHP